MKKRLLGILTVSEVGMGCMGFSHGYGVPPEESYAVEAIRKAFDFGCTLFDTAETYGREQFYPVTTKSWWERPSPPSGKRRCWPPNSTLR